MRLPPASATANFQMGEIQLVGLAGRHIGRLLGSSKLIEYLSERSHAASAGLSTDFSKAFDFGGIGDFGEGLDAGGGHVQQQHLVAAAHQVNLLPAD